MYIQVKQLLENKRNRINAVKDENGKILYDPASIKKRWKEYIEELCGKDTKPSSINLENEQEVESDDVRPEMLDSEIDRVLHDMKGNKAMGIDEIPVELLKHLGEKGKRDFYNLCR